MGRRKRTEEERIKAYEEKKKKSLEYYYKHLAKNAPKPKEKKTRTYHTGSVIISFGRNKNDFNERKEGTIHIGSRYIPFDEFSNFSSCIISGKEIASEYFDHLMKYFGKDTTGSVGREGDLPPFVSWVVVKK